MDTEADRERRTRAVVGALKHLADASEGRNPRQALMKAVGKLVVLKLRTEHEKSASAISAIALAVKAEQELGPGWIDLEPETLREAGFTNPEIEQLYALKLVLYSSIPFSDWHVFANFASIFAGEPWDPGTIPDPSVLDLAWCVEIMRYLDPHTPFTPEIASYVACVALDHGLVRLPSSLGFADERLAEILRDHGRDLRLDDDTNEASRRQQDLRVAIEAHVESRHRRLMDELQDMGAD